MSNGITDAALRAATEHVTRYPQIDNRKPLGALDDVVVDVGRWPVGVLGTQSWVQHTPQRCRSDGPSR